MCAGGIAICWWIAVWAWCPCATGCRWSRNGPWTRWRAIRISTISAATMNSPVGCATKPRRRFWPIRPARPPLADPYVTDEIFTALPPAPYLSTAYAVKSAPATRVLQDGDRIDLGDRSFEVIHTPGHSPGGIALWEAASGVLFSGDIVYDGPLIEDTYHSNAADYHASMVRLYDLPVRIVHGGHFASYDRARHRGIIKAWLDDKDR